MKRQTKASPKMTDELRHRMMKAIAEEEEPKVIAATSKQARAALKQRTAIPGDPVADLLESIRQERERQNLSLRIVSCL